MTAAISALLERRYSVRCLFFVEMIRFVLVVVLVLVLDSSHFDYENEEDEDEEDEEEWLPLLITLQVLAHGHHLFQTPAC